MSYRYGNYKTVNDYHNKNQPNPVLNEPVILTGDPLRMKWETLEYSNSADPKVWGAAFWFSIHNGCTKYPVKATPVISNRMKGFIMGLPYMIPCQNCMTHAQSHIENNYDNLDEICSGRDNLFKFFVDFHNYVNKRYGKQEITYDNAYKKYMGRINVTKLVYD